MMPKHLRDLSVAYFYYLKLLLHILEKVCRTARRNPTVSWAGQDVRVSQFQAEFQALGQFRMCLQRSGPYQII